MFRLGQRWYRRLDRGYVRFYGYGVVAGLLLLCGLTYSSVFRRAPVGMEWALVVEVVIKPVLFVMSTGLLALVVRFFYLLLVGPEHADEPVP